MLHLEPLELHVVGKSSLVDALQSVVVDDERLQIWQINECVFVQDFDAIIAQVDLLDVVGVAEQTRGKFLDFVLGQQKFLQLLHEEKVAELDEPKLRFRYLESSQVGKGRAKSLGEITRAGVVRIEGHHVLVIFSRLVLSSHVLNARVSRQYRHLLDVAAVTARQ